jgi:SAM-dependent methyltransferase
VSYCNVCNLRGDFLTYLGDRENEICPYCGSISRTRALWQYLTKKIKDAFTQNILHIAPDVTLHTAIKMRCDNNYTTCDIEKRKGVYIQCDIQQMPFIDKQFDIIICSHVLEHIKDDKQALKEMKRITKDDGQILICIPQGRQAGTLEYSWTNTEALRKKYYGQDNHVRLYGWNFGDILGKHNVFTYRGEKVFIVNGN